MALDKQRLLSELGNVMNQLKSADCGCMGKLFNQGQGHGHGQGMSSQGMASQGMASQGMASQGMASQGMSSQGMSSQGMSSQGYGGCCRRGYGHPCCGEPYTMGEGMPAHGRPCMSYCNAPKLYADGYNFMNQNVMQPVIKEVYDDLRSLNSGNTVTNNPLGAQMGLTPTLPGEGNMNQNAQMGNMNANPGGQSMGRGHPMMQHMQAQHMQMAGGQQMVGGQSMAGGQSMPGGQPMASSQSMSGGQPMAGGGQEISGDTSGGLANFNKMFPGVMQGQGGGLAFNPMEIAMQMNPALGKQQPGMEATQNPMSGGMAQQAQNPMSGSAMAQPAHSSMSGGGMAQPGQNPMSGGMAQSANSNGMQPGMNAANFAPNQTAQGYQAQPNTMNQAMPNQQTNQAYTAHTGNQLPSNFPPQGMNQNAQMGRMNANQGGQGGSYGQHTAGISKFKEMFPGVMQGLGGDVNFDPMEIAIQMNPANKQTAAMSSMEKLMSAKPLEANSSAMKPVVNGMNAVNANFAPNQAASAQGQPQPDQASNQIQPNQQQYATNQIPPNQQQNATNQIQPNQQQYATNPATIANQPHMQQPQQVYTALTDNQGRQVLQQETNAQNYQEVEPPQPMSQGYPNQVPGGRVYEKEPILPVDNSRYNTIGQPIELLQTRKYRMAEPNLPQTLSPQGAPSRLRVNNNVKSTMSKTSLFARQQGRTASRAQLQQVYNQYKGSQSYTNQNQYVREPAQGHTASDGRLNAAPPVTEKRQIPVERVGGDTAANNQAYEPVKGGHAVGQVGDVVANKPAPHNFDLVPTKSANLRNGLQDMVFTAYPQSTAWSFHGRSDQPRHSIRA